MIERLRHRKLNQELLHLQELKEKLSSKRIELVKHIKSAPWTFQELDAFLKTLKKGKC